MQFIQSCVEAGFPKDQLSDDASIFDGMRVHLSRVKDKSYKPKPGMPPPKREPSVLLVTKIHSLPWDAPEAPATNGLTPIEQKAQTAIEQLTRQKGTIHRKDFFQALMVTLSGDPDLNAIIQTAYSEPFLSRADQPWSYNPATDTVTEDDPKF